MCEDTFKKVGLLTKCSLVMGSSLKKVNLYLLLENGKIHIFLSSLKLEKRVFLIFIKNHLVSGSEQ